MAKPEDKWFDNIEETTVIGDKTYSFYCDWACIHCNLCNEATPDHFQSSIEFLRLPFVLIVIL